jgi:RecA-family ATPase
MPNKEQRVTGDIERVWSKEMTEQDTANDNPLLTSETYEQYGVGDKGGEPIIEKVLNRQEVLQIFAPSGVGKSIYVDNIIAALLSGEPMFGEFKVVAPHDVYLCDFEMSSRERGERLRSIVHDAKARCWPVNFMNLGYKLNNAQHFAHFAEAMRKFKPAVIVIDPWKAAHTADENDASEIEPIIGNIRKLLFEINASAIIVHHAGRDFVTRTGERAARHGRGSTVLDDRSDIIWEVEETSDADVTTLRPHKLRGFQKEMAHEYKMRYDRVTGVIVSIAKRGEHADFVKHKRQQLKLTQDELAAMLGVSGRTVRFWEAGRYNPPNEVLERLKQ